MPSRRVKAPMWLADVERHDYVAAVSYLSLIYPTKQAVSLAARLRRTALVQFKAKDVFRASRLSLLGVRETLKNWS